MIGRGGGNSGKSDLEVEGKKKAPLRKLSEKDFLRGKYLSGRAKQD